MSVAVVASSVIHVPWPTDVTADRSFLRQALRNPSSFALEGSLRSIDIVLSEASRLHEILRQEEISV